MIVSIMQPYFFPYIGYFQLLGASDVFVVLDDVQFMKGGWINRNRILVGDQPKWLTFPVCSAHFQLPIMAREYRAAPDDRQAILNAVSNAYRMAPEFGSVMPLVEQLMEFPDANIATFNAHLIRAVADEIGVECRIIRSSEVPKGGALAGQDRVLAICEAIGADVYVNPIGGKDLYERSAFAARGMELNFLQSNLPPYDQGAADYVPALSIIDMLMFCGPEERGRQLKGYRLVESS